MPSAAHLAIFTLAALAMNAAPGPSNLYVLSRSLAQGAAGGLVSALGLALGSLFHVALAVAGLAALLSYAPTLYDAIRLAGAAYLIYLGIKTLRAPGASMPANGGARRSLARILFDAALVEMLNPKTALFFLAFLPQFVEPAPDRRAPQLLLWADRDADRPPATCSWARRRQLARPSRPRPAAAGPAASPARP
jgi:threonine/homoserine/homoserine lactone efflux protein